MIVRPDRLGLAVMLVSTLTCAPRGDSPSTRDTLRVDSMSSAAGGYATAITGPLSDSIVHLATGDSLEFQSFGRAQVTGQPDGLLVTYHPFFAISDTARVRRAAIVFFDSLRTKLRNGEPPFVMLRAVDLRAADRMSSTRRELHGFGVVLEKRADGLWYPLNGASPIQAR